MQLTMLKRSSSFLLQRFAVILNLLADFSLLQKLLHCTGPLIPKERAALRWMLLGKPRFCLVKAHQERKCGGKSILELGRDYDIKAVVRLNSLSV